MDKRTEKRIVAALYDLLDYHTDAEIMHDSHRMYSADDRKAHKRKIASIENLLTKF